MKNLKTYVIALITGMLIIGKSVHASFPTKSHEQKVQQTQQLDELKKQDAAVLKQDILKEQTKVTNSDSYSNGLDEKTMLLLLWFFLGGLAAHRWYKGKPAIINILFIITAGGCGIWALIDLINILTDKF
jgi:hypothetical protein